MTPTPVGKGAAWPSPPPGLVPVNVRVRLGGEFHLSPTIQNYQTRALSDTHESKNTYSDKTDRPRFGYPGPSSKRCQQSSENAVEFLPTAAARTRPRPRTQARLPRATHAQRLQVAVHPLLAYLGRDAVFFLYRNVGAGLLVCVRTSTATSAAIWSSGRGDLWPTTNDVG